jgi:hypothetical protein
MECSKVVNPYFPGQVHYFALPAREAAKEAFALYTMGIFETKSHDWPIRDLGDGSFLCGNWRAIPC